MMKPFVMKYLVDFFKTGENPWKEHFEFWDLSEYPQLTWLTQDIQYGLFLILMLNLTNILNIPIQEHFWF